MGLLGVRWGTDDWVWQLLINLTLIRKTQEVVSKVNWWNNLFDVFFYRRIRHLEDHSKNTKMHWNKWELNSKPAQIIPQRNWILKIHDRAWSWTCFLNYSRNRQWNTFSWWAWTEFMHFSCYWSDFCFDFFSWNVCARVDFTLECKPHEKSSFVPSDLNRMPLNRRHFSCQFRR